MHLESSHKAQWFFLMSPFDSSCICFNIRVCVSAIDFSTTTTYEFTTSLPYEAKGLCIIFLEFHFLFIDYAEKVFWPTELWEKMTTCCPPFVNGLIIFSQIHQKSKRQLTWIDTEKNKVIFYLSKAFSLILALLT